MATKTKSKKKMSVVPQAKESARNVWLAGVGALAIAEDEKDRSYATFKTNLEKAKNLIPVSFEHGRCDVPQARYGRVALFWHRRHPLARRPAFVVARASGQFVFDI